MRNSKVREIFFSYFTKKNHYKVLSSPLIPAKDPTILFTNAGMNQFKDIFLQKESRQYKKAVSIQKCMRVSGKHNDFDEVGKTEYHHTFFEMLGNFSFGNYFKEKAIEYAWELLTIHYNFKPENLWTSIFEKDDDAFTIWEKNIGVPAQKIVRLSEKDNFWQMGETGPCGPCSEIYYDKGEKFGPDNLAENSQRFVEIWNLVFLQFHRDEQGELNPLPAPSIDTGMGMERLTSLLQGVNSNYQTDLFLPIVEFIAELSGINPNDKNHQVSIKVIADHTRALSFLISDGVLPSNDGRGYILRRLLRRAARHGKSLGFSSPFMHKVSTKVIQIMKEFYPELEYNRNFVAEVILAEEERFNRTLLNGLKRFEEYLEQALDNKQKMIAGKELFKLSDTYGFPLDFATDLATEKDIKIDYQGFQKELESQRTKSRDDLMTKKKSSVTIKNIEKYTTRFIGYDHLRNEATLLAIYSPYNNGKNYQEIPLLEASKSQKSSDVILLVFDQTPFYPESGGQVGDIGSGVNEDSYIQIKDTQRTPEGAILHLAELRKGKLKPGEKVILEVDKTSRNNTAIHHSATHLLHYALREILGLHVKQAGSYVGPDKLRFDFTHFKPLSDEEIKKIEKIVNNKIRENIPVSSSHKKYENAVQDGALALFEEKYSENVRVITMGNVSQELCGGTHLESSGEIGFFKIVSESSIASGIRRIEALGGEACYTYIQENLNILHDLQSHFKQSKESVYDFLLDLDKNLKEKEKELRKTKKGNQRPNFDKIITNTTLIKNIQTVVEFVNNFNRDQLRSLADEIKNKNRGISVLLSNINGKSAIIVSVFNEITTQFDARVVIKEIAELVHGDGGGRADFAQAGGKPIQDILFIKKSISNIIKKHIK